MKKLLSASLLFIFSLSLLLQGGLASAGSMSEQQVRQLFSVYGYTPSAKDVSFWSAHKSNGRCVLEGCLQARFAKDHNQPMVDRFSALGDANLALQGGLLGAAIPQRPTEFTTSLGEQKTEAHSNTTLKVTSITTKDSNTLSGAVLGTRIVLSLNPGASNSEIVVCTGLTVATKTFTGCTFGYRFDNPSLTSSTNVKAHSPGEPVIISNTDTYNAVNFVSTTGDHNVLGLLIFDQYPTASSTLGSPTSSLQFVTKNYADNLANTGAATSTESTTGIVRLGTQIQIASSTNQTDIPTVLYSKYSTSSPYTAGLWVPVSQNNGQLHSNWFTQGNASTSFYGLTAPNNNLNNIGWWGNAFRDFFASGTIYANKLNISSSGASSTNPFNFKYDNTTYSVSGQGELVTTSIDLPAGTMASTSMIKLFSGGDRKRLTNSTSSVRLYFGGVIIASSTFTPVNTATGNEYAQWGFDVLMGNKGSLTSQWIRVTSGMPTSSYLNYSSSVNTAVDQILKLEIGNFNNNDAMIQNFANIEIQK